MSDVLWTLDDVWLEGRRLPRLAGVTCAIRPGVTAVIGCSGAGKTSLLNLLVGFEQPDRGTVSRGFDGQADALPLYWVPPGGGLWPQKTALEHLLTVAPRPAPQAKKAMLELLASLDIAHRADAHPGQLSQGERSRLAVARALAAEPRVLVMDEAFVSVDPARTGRYWNVIRGRLDAIGGSLVFSTHVEKAVLAHAAEAICLSEGRLLFQGAVDDLYWRPPTAELAAFLGEANWLAPEDAALWLGAGDGRPQCVRPEQLEVRAAADGPLHVRAARFHGAVAEVDLEHEPTGRQRTFYHRPSGNALRAGMRAVLRLLPMLLLLFAAMLPGCGSGRDPALRVSRVDLWQLPPDGARIPAPRSIGIGLDDTFYVLDTVGRVLLYDAEGKVLKHWWMPEYKVGRPESVCLLKDGRIAVADTHYHRVVFFDRDGTELGRFGREGRGPGEFIYPVGVCQGAKGNLYVCEYGGNDRVQEFTPDGKFVRAFGAFGTGPQDFQRPSGLVWVDGKVHVADAINNRVQVFTDDGRFVRTLGGPGGELALAFPYDIALGPDGTLYVAEYGAGRVTRMDAEGRLLGRFGQRGRGKGELFTPWGIAVDSKGRVRVADTGNSRVVGLTP